MSRSRFSFAAMALVLLTALPAAAVPLRVVATVPDLGSLVRELGGEHVAVTVLAKGTEDPHFVEPKPSFVKALHRADLLVLIGMDLEIGWLPTLLRQARNAAVLPGAPGYVEAAAAITPLEVPTGAVDRALGDIHLWGNPHFLLDPVQGLRVARLLRDRLAALRPAARDVFASRYRDFARRLAQAMVGEALAERYDVEQLALLYEQRRLLPFLEARGEAALLQGWFSRLAPYAGTRAVADHNLWPYFARRFRLELVGFMEPKPGIPPTTGHLQALVHTMHAQGVRLILTSPYYDPRHAQFLARQTGARIATMAHQVGSRPGIETYFDLHAYNVQQLLAALAGE